MIFWTIFEILLGRLISKYHVQLVRLFVVLVKPRWRISSKLLNFISDRIDRHAVWKIQNFVPTVNSRSCLASTSHALSKSLNFRQLSLSQTLMHSHQLSCVLREFELSSTLALVWPLTLMHCYRVWARVHIWPLTPMCSHQVCHTV